MPQCMYPKACGSLFMCESVKSLVNVQVSLFKIYKKRQLKLLFFYSLQTFSCLTLSALKNHGLGQSWVYKFCFVLIILRSFIAKIKCIFICVSYLVRNNLANQLDKSQSVFYWFWVKDLLG